ncbi:MAG: hypothetical protein GX804_04100 [Lentisphaerae bacterium]|jgi:hypothetical protein|nr:hypothetical protein [Lentisphaerota bacterium]
MKTIFKYLLLSGVFLCAVQLQSTATTLPHLPEAVFADTEVSTNVTLSTWSEHVPTFRISVSLDATPSNNVQIAIGEDVSGDELLDDNEQAFMFGWDCGRWFMEGFEPGSRFYAEPESDEPGRKTLLLTMYLKADGSVHSTEATEANSPVDFQYSEENPDFTVGLSVKDWDVAKLVARGTGFKNESIKVSFKNDVTIFTVR